MHVSTSPRLNVTTSPFPTFPVTTSFLDTMPFSKSLRLQLLCIHLHARLHVTSTPCHFTPLRLLAFLHPTHRNDVVTWRRACRCIGSHIILSIGLGACRCVGSTGFTCMHTTLSTLHTCMHTTLSTLHTCTQSCQQDCVHAGV